MKRAHVLPQLAFPSRKIIVRITTLLMAGAILTVGGAATGGGGSRTGNPGRAIVVNGTANGATDVLGGCPGVGPHVVSQGTFDTVGLGTGAYRLEGCVALGNPQHFTGDGTFELTTHDGVLSGTLHSENGFVAPSTVHTVIDLTIGGGTNWFNGATGSLRFDGTSRFIVSGHAIDSFTVSGSISLGPRCHSRGWLRTPQPCATG
jgi:hypothetical protein